MPATDAEIFDCRWLAEEWAEKPYMYNVVGESVTEEYRGPDSQIIGYFRRNVDEWTMKFYRDRGYSAWVSEFEEYIRIQRGGIIYRWDGDKHSAGTFGNEVEMKHAPDDVILPVIRGMKAQKWRGFYGDSIDFILEITGIRRTEI